jgi:hypothetical protein
VNLVFLVYYSDASLPLSATYSRCALKMTISCSMSYPVQPSIASVKLV